MASRGTSIFTQYKTTIPPVLLALGGGVWRWISGVSNLDFLLSMKGQTCMLMFDFFMNYGWWLMVIGGIVWLVFARQDPEKGEFGLDMVLVVGLLAFLAGIIVTGKATGTVPDITISYGQSPHGCEATYDTGKLRRFRDRYDIVLMCGLNDSSTDKFFDTNISISKPFNILLGPIPITAPFSKNLVEAFATLVNRRTGREVEISMWTLPVLVPQGTDMDIIHSLSDVTKDNGKILAPAYFQ